MQWVKNKQGFTIVELLIVVVVIAILAAITIVSYTGIQNRTHDSAVQSDIKNFSKIVEMHNAEKSSYPFPLTKAMGIKATQGSYMDRNNLYYCVHAASNNYAVAAISKSGKGYSYSSNGGLKEYTNGEANVSGAQTCNLAGGSTWGWDVSYGVYAHDQNTKWNTTWLN